MSASLFGAALRASRARVANAARQTRMMSAEAAEHQAHHEASMKQWEKITKIALPVLGVVAVANVVIHFQHGHHHEEPKFSYQHIRKKKFPWDCSDCALFDGECWSKCRKN